MTAQIRIVGMFEDVPVEGTAVIINTTSRAETSWERDLSPFHLGPCRLYGSFVAARMENAWQHSKVYAEHVCTVTGEPTPEYWVWAKAGWANLSPVRYPMGKGRHPLFSLWDGQKFGYVEARKRIYIPLYAEVVQRTEGWRRLVELYRTRATTIVLRDFDGYDHVAFGRTLTDVLNDPNRKMGHAFVLAMLLTKDAALEQVTLREPPVNL